MLNNSHYLVFCAKQMLFYSRKYEYVDYEFMLIYKFLHFYLQRICSSFSTHTHTRNVNGWPMTAMMLLLFGAVPIIMNGTIAFQVLCRKVDDVFWPFHFVRTIIGGLIVGSSKRQAREARDKSVRSGLAFVSVRGVHFHVTPRT